MLFYFFRKDDRILVFLKYDSCETSIDKNYFMVHLV